ncbi:MAG: DUF4838 domain-containing protein [Elusimicrobia bacterium]|nr:DUF4838 domain-containing protein [Elusimicrobiota bacterium]
MTGAVLLAAALCRGGSPLMPVVIAEGASARTREAARDLSVSLGRVCGRPFAVETGDGTRGLALGTAADFPALRLSGEFTAEEPMRREQYLLRSRENGLTAVGATEAGVEAAAADLLYRAGWRRFFPGPSWEVVPSKPDLSLAVDVKTAPAYAARRIWYGLGEAEANEKTFDAWRRRNRVPGAFDLETGHAYESIIERNLAEFTAHAEYRGLYRGRRSSTKLCLSNPGLRRLLVEDAARRFAENPARDSSSVEPSDGEEWCECAACAAMGSVSDRVVAAANEVAAMLAERFPGKYAAFYAYNEHAPAPAGRVAARVIVSVATAYLPKGLDPESLMRAWSARGARLGVREYWGIYQWHRSLPARMRGGDLAYLARTIPRFHALGARFFSAESGEDWGANGLGYYAAARMLWDLDEAGRVDAIREDFLDKAFGAAKEPMRRFYALIDGSRGLPGRKVPAPLVADMYARLREARALSPGAPAMLRLDDLVLYTRYAQLYGAYEDALTGRQAAFEAMLRHARRMKSRQMVYLRPIEEYAAVWEKRTLPADDGAGDYTRAEVEEILRRGAAVGS